MKSIDEDWWLAQDPVILVSGAQRQGRRGRFNLSVAPRRASISEGPWRYSRHASHARKLARDRTLVARAAARVRGARRLHGRGEGGKGARRGAVRAGGKCRDGEEEREEF